MEKTSDTEKYDHYLTANAVIESWMIEYKRYLLDGDPNIIHPKAKAALVLGMVDALANVTAQARLKPRAKPGTAKDDAKS